MAQCGYCGNKLIGVSRKQSWKRRSGERVENSYRYYQCESRTNQSVCSYHTRRADVLEADVHAALVKRVAEGGFAPAPSATAEVADAARERERLEARLRRVDRRIATYVDAASHGALTKEKMRRLGVKAASDRLALEDALEAAERRAAGADIAGEGPSIEAARLLAAGWSDMAFAPRQAALREALARIVVTDDAVAVEMR
jgi:hypothetical protein